MERESAWKRYDEDQLAELEQLAAGYIDFISENKTEREFSAAAIRSAEAAGYESLDAAISAGRKLAPGDKVWATMRNKAVILVQLGARPLTDGMNILGAHIDSPRLDVKQNPLYESSELAFMDTHYYGGIKHYQWVTVPLALHGVIAKKDGSVVDVKIGEDADDPVFCISDLLIHLANQQMGKKANEVVEGEALDILVGNRPLVVRDEDGEAKEQKDPVKAFALKLLADKYGIEEEDFLSAELEVVPAGRARDLGFDRSMVLGYGQDDSVCAYTSLVAQLAVAGEELDRAAVCVLVDKEEIGSVGATGMASQFFENTIAEIMELAGEGGMLPLRRALAASAMLSSDVSAGFDPAYASVFEAKNSAYLGHGLVFNKYTGARGKSGSNDARAEYVARIRKIMDDAGVQFQTCELACAAATLESIAMQVRLLQQTDVIEAEEPFKKGQKGSSAMPHKRNPITAERVCGLARCVKANAQVALDNVALWYERDISHSGTERVALADSFTALDYMFAKMQWILDGLQTYPAKMEHNVWRTKGLIFSSKVLLALVNTGITREEAYVIVQRNAMAVWEDIQNAVDGPTYRERLENDPEAKLSKETLDEIFDPWDFLTRKDEVFKRLEGLEF